MAKWHNVITFVVLKLYIIHINKCTHKMKLHRYLIKLVAIEIRKIPERFSFSAFFLKTTMIFYLFLTNKCYL